MGFVIDASGSVGLDTFSREKNFVKLVSRRIAASSPDTRLGLIVFSDTPKLFVDFGDYGRMTIDQFQTTVDQVPFQGGRSRIDLALRAASQDFFTNRRSGVPRVSKKNTIQVVSVLEISFLISRSTCGVLASQQERGIMYSFYVTVSGPERNNHGQICHIKLL